MRTVAELLAIALALMFLLPVPAPACTWGTDCIEDCLTGAALTSGPDAGYKNAGCHAKNLPVDSKVLVVEGYNNPLYHDDGPTGGPGGPGSRGSCGPWYDTGQTPYRGWRSCWSTKWGSAPSSLLWQPGEPANPKRGVSCTCKGCQGCGIAGFVFPPGNPNAYDAPQRAGVAIFRNGEFNAEVASMGAGPVDPNTGQAGVPGGSNAMFGARVPKGTDGTGGITGHIEFPGAPYREVGMTTLYAFPPNVATSGVANDMWKGNECTYEANGSGGNSCDVVFGYAHALDARVGTFPFYGAIFADYRLNQPTRQSICNQAVANATVNAGSLRCDREGNVLFGAKTPDYTQSRDWPLGTVGCVSAYWRNLGAPPPNATALTVTLQVGTKVQTIFDGANIDLSRTSSAPGMYGRSPDAYANANAGPQYGSVYTTEVTYRLEGNHVTRNGAPLTCAQLGYGVSAR